MGHFSLEHACRLPGQIKGNQIIQFILICKNIYCGFRMLTVCSRDVSERTVIAGEHVLKEEKHER